MPLAGARCRGEMASPEAHSHAKRLKVQGIQRRSTFGHAQTIERDCGSCFEACSSWVSLDGRWWRSRRNRRAGYGPERQRVSEPEMMGSRIEVVIWRAVDGPTPEHVARERCPCSNLQSAATHAVVGLDRFRPSHARVWHQLHFDDAGPLFIRSQKLRGVNWTLNPLCLADAS